MGRKEILSLLGVEPRHSSPYSATLIASSWPVGTEQLYVTSDK